MREIRLFEAFSGIGAQLMGMRMLEHTVVKPVGCSDIDKYAIDAYAACHGDITNYGDISKIDWGQVPDFDLFTYSSPCTSFSSLGRKDGGEEGSGTASSLLWECRRAISEKRPKYLLMENVSDIAERKFVKTLHKWMRTLEEFGYENSAFILDSANFGVCQNRKRMFMVSALGGFERPFSIPLGAKKRAKLADILDDEPQNCAKAPKKITDKFGGVKLSEPLIAPRTHGFLKLKTFKLCPALTTSCGSDYFVLQPGREPRAISTKEAFRMMGVPEEYISKLHNAGIPQTQLYKMAGNSIVVPVIASIFKNLFEPDLNDPTQTTIF